MLKRVIDFIVNTIIAVKNKGFFHLFSASIFVKVVAFGSQFFVAWWLSVEEIGDIKIIQTYFSLFTVMVLFGFNSSILKLCSEPRPLEQIVGLYKKGKKYIIASFAILFPIFIVLIIFKVISHDARINYYLLILLIGLFPSVMNEADTIYLQARKKVKLMSYRQIFIKSSSLFLIIVLTFIFGINGYILAYIISLFLAFIAFIFIISKIDKGIIPQNIENSLKEHWHYSKFAVLALLFGQISSYADVYMMNLFIDDKKIIGLYSFALLLMLIPTVFSSVIQQIAVPYISNKSKRIEEIKNTFRKYQKINLLSAAIIYIISIIVVPLSVRLIFDQKYSGSIVFFQILILAWLFNSISQLKGLYLWGTGFINYNLYITIIITICKFVVSYILMRKFGILGISYGILISNIIGIFVYELYFKTALRLYKHQNISH